MACLISSSISALKPANISPILLVICSTTPERSKALPVQGVWGDAIGACLDIDGGVDATVEGMAAITGGCDLCHHQNAPSPPHAQQPLSHAHGRNPSSPTDHLTASSSPFVVVNG